MLLTTAFKSDPLWLQDKREIAFDAFCLEGLPAGKNERYKYTPIKQWFSNDFSASQNEEHTLDLNKLPFFSEKKNTIRVVLVNGWLYKEATVTSPLPKGVIIGSMATDGLVLHADLIEKYFSAQETTNWETTLNTAMWTDGVLIVIPADTVCETTLEIIHISTGDKKVISNTKNSIVVEKNSAVNIVEYAVSVDLKATTLVNTQTDVFVGENAQVKYYKVQQTASNTGKVHVIATTQVKQEKNSHFDTNTFSIGNNFIRNNLTIALDGENCEAHLNGLFLVDGTEHIDNQTAVYHNQPHCQSNQLYKGILNGKSTGVFNGRIYVKRDAQKTNAYQSSKNILLSDDASINTKPELEIYADDVKCSHGSSTGKIEEQALFYLRSRGIGEESARRLLLNAFAGDVLNTIRNEEFKKYLEGLLNKKLEV
jgi:Fe-S cluster assembly protein SufD